MRSAGCEEFQAAEAWFRSYMHTIVGFLAGLCQLCRLAVRGTKMIISIVYPVCVLVGLSLIYTACFLYEAEEQRVQFALEHTWIRVDDLRQRATPRYVAVLQRRAGFISRALDVVFGARLFSLHSLNAGIAFSLAPLLSNFIVFATATHAGNPFKYHGWIVRPIEFATVVILYFLGFRIASSRRRMVTVSPTILLIGLLILLGWSASALLVLYGALRDLLYIAIARKTLRMIEKTETLPEALARITAAAALGGVVACMQILVELLYRKALAMTGVTAGTLMTTMLVTTGGVLNMVLFAFWVILMLFAFVHAAVWPAMDRPLYFLTRIKVFEHKKAVFILGLTLACVPIPGLLGELLKFLKQCCF
jgi:hypothetical protein